MKNKVLSVLREYLGEEETLLDSKTMDFLMDGILTDDDEVRYLFAIYINLLIEIQKNYEDEYQKFQYYLTNEEKNTVEVCLTILKKIVDKTDELKRLENLLIHQQ